MKPTASRVQMKKEASRMAVVRDTLYRRPTREKVVVVVGVVAFVERFSMLRFS